MSEPNRKRILLVTRNLPPLLGGMERLNWHMADELSKHAEVRIVGPTGSAAAAPAATTVDEVPLRPLWKFLLHVQWRAWRVARAWKPGVVLAGSGLAALAALWAARACGARAAVYVHGLDLAVRHPVYRCLWHPALRRMDSVIANSRPTAELARRIGVKPACLGIVHPGVDLPVAHEHSQGGGEAGGTAFRQRHHLGRRPLLLSVGRLSTRKGLREFVAHALPPIVAAQPNVMLLVVGDAPRDALHAQAQTRDSILAVAEQAGVAGNLRFLGKITDADLEDAYRAADVHVFPVRDIPGDPEGFGMVAVEAAAHGLPTVAFATGGVVDAVAEGRSGLLVSPGDYSAFAQTVQQALVQRDSMRKSSRAFATQFVWPEFGKGVREALAVASRPSLASFEGKQ